MREERSWTSDINGRFSSSVEAMNALLDCLGEAGARVIMEATGLYEYVYEAIEVRGFKVVLTHPLKLRALTAGRTKNNRNDAEMLAELLRLDAVPT